MFSMWWARAFACPGLPVLAAILPLQALGQFLTTWGYPAVLLFVMIESTGIPFPGETMLLLGAFFAASGHLSIVGVIAAAATGAILGDNLGYWIGRKGGRPIVRRFGRYVFVREQQLVTAERFFQRHGDKTVFFGRFISILRAWAAFLAGVNQMRWPIFLFYNAAGGICWSIIFGVLGYSLGRAIGVDTLERYASDLGYVVLGLVVLLASLFFLRRAWRKRREQPASTSDTSTGSASPPGTRAQVRDEGKRPGV
jgi:membrane protein DedA with SNARE-associated domain